MFKILVLQRYYNLSDEQMQFQILDRLAAQHLYHLAKDDMAKFLGESSHVKRLNRLNIYQDFEFCLKIDEYKVLPRLKNGVLVGH
jgi:2-phosphosulfolactate phosphatase